jgi:WD40 repeat protein
VAWSPDGTRVLTGSDDGSARIWDAATGKVLHHMAGHHHEVNSVAWSPDGTRVLTGSDDGSARIWDAATGEESGPVFTHFTDGEVAVYHPTTNSVLGCTDGAWRWLGWNIRNDSVDRLPAETFGELPPIDPTR